jgi:hypothetical protein
MSELTIGEAKLVCFRVKVVASNGRRLYRDERIGAYESRVVAMNAAYERALRMLPDDNSVRVFSRPAPSLR